jgi:hypothetical protein
MERSCTYGELTANTTIMPDRVPLAAGSAGRPEKVRVTNVAISGAQAGISPGPLAPSLA